MTAPAIETTELPVFDHQPTCECENSGPMCCNPAAWLVVNHEPCIAEWPSIYVCAMHFAEALAWMARLGIQCEECGTEFTVLNHFWPVRTRL